MSFKSKWKQFINWVDEHSAKNSDFQSDTFDPTVTGDGDWQQAEAQSNAQFNEYSLDNYWKQAGFAVAGYWDNLLGIKDGKPQPPPPPVTGNKDIDTWILAAVVIVVLVVVWKLVKAIFS